jgi:hypothetical protein
MIRREDHHRRHMLARRDPAGAQRDRGRSIPLRGFRDDVRFREIREQRAHGGFLFHIRENEDAIPRHQPVQPFHRLLKQRLVRDELQQLFRA